MLKSKNKNLKKSISIILVISMLVCSMFSMSATAKSYASSYDDAELTHIAEAIALEMGVPIENIRIDPDSIRVVSAEELAILKGNDVTTNHFNRNISVNSAACCSNPNIQGVVMLATIYGGWAVPSGYSWIYAEVVMEKCSNCGALGNLVSVLRIINKG